MLTLLSLTSGSKILAKILDPGSFADTEDGAGVFGSQHAELDCAVCLCLLVLCDILGCVNSSRYHISVIHLANDYLSCRQVTSSFR
jgi:hypothetical protein